MFSNFEETRGLKSTTLDQDLSLTMVSWLPVMASMVGIVTVMAVGAGLKGVVVGILQRRRSSI